MMVKKEKAEGREGEGLQYTFLETEFQRKLLAREGGYKGKRVLAYNGRNLWDDVGNILRET